MSDYFDRNGEPMTEDQWLARSDYPHYRRVAYTRFTNGIAVSTVWLGIDFSFGEGGPPVIFETMTFQDDESDDSCWRYSTEDQAINGHNRVVNDILAMRKDIELAVEHQDVWRNA